MCTIAMVFMAKATVTARGRNETLVTTDSRDSQICCSNIMILKKTASNYHCMRRVQFAQKLPQYIRVGHSRRWQSTVLTYNLLIKPHVNANNAQPMRPLVKSYFFACAFYKCKNPNIVKVDKNEPHYFDATKVPSLSTTLYRTLERNPDYDPKDKVAIGTRTKYNSNTRTPYNAFGIQTKVQKRDKRTSLVRYKDINPGKAHRISINTPAKCIEAEGPCSRIAFRKYRSIMWLLYSPHE